MAQVAALFNTRRWNVSEIEISEADEAIADRLCGVDYRKFPGDRDRNAELIAEVRLAATAAGESRVADAVKAERERIKKIVCDYALSIHDPYDVSAAWALENVARMLTPTPEATT